MIQNYPIGVPGVPWGEVERAHWRSSQKIQRSYQEQVMLALAHLSDALVVTTYDYLQYPEGQYPLIAVHSANWRRGKPAILITGGVHGYETSGVLGALSFLENNAEAYSAHFNVFVAPCVSPWAFETINRWNPDAIDPNRAFYTGSPCREARALMSAVGAMNAAWIAHFDLHETTDTDNSEFRPALSARDGTVQEAWAIPDGFYLVGDSAAPAADFQQAIIRSVEQATPIAPSDSHGCLIGVPTEQQGVINYDVAALGLCMGMTDAKFRTTTEVYPDSPRVDAATCVSAQVLAVCGGLDFLLANSSIHSST